MSDLKLLEAAAKAAGINVRRGTGFQKDWLFQDTPCNDGIVRGMQWNPLTDDGDALRLAVKLKIPLQFPDFQDIACTWGAKNDTSEYIEAALNHNGDLAAAVRRAIVRAAAAISSQNRGVE